MWQARAFGALCSILTKNFFVFGKVAEPATRESAGLKGERRGSECIKNVLNQRLGVDLSV